MDDIAADILMHYGTKYHSGRYPYGSGQDPRQHGIKNISDKVKELRSQGLTEKEIQSTLGITKKQINESGVPKRYTKVNDIVPRETIQFMDKYNQLKADGKTELEIAQDFGIKSPELRAKVTLGGHTIRRARYEVAKEMYEDGVPRTEIGRRMGGLSESTVRSILDIDRAERMNKAMMTAETLKKELNEKGMLDVGAGVEKQLNISRNKLDEALDILKEEGYNVYPVGIPQVNQVKKQSNTRILTNPETTHKYVYDNMGEINNVGTHKYDAEGGYSSMKPDTPTSMSSDRVFIRYGDEGGSLRDGTIEIRRGVKDLTLGNSSYAQCRVLVDGDKYMKGMALYSDDVPDGFDIIYNTNKPKGTPASKVFKKAEDSTDNPFGSTFYKTGQTKYIDSKRKEQLSPINKLKEEGDWDSMSRNMSSQFLSKQPKKLIQQQLNLAKADKAAELDDINSLTLAPLRRKLLMDYAGSCESAAVHLRGAAAPGQKIQVILPVTKLKDTEIYAPGYEQGSKVALVRYPHGGTFEIPILTVNNKNTDAIKILGPKTKDAVGINLKVAERLSGADFDGDQVVVIPQSSSIKVKNSNPLKGLAGFNPTASYGPDKTTVDSKGNEHYYRNGKEYKAINKKYKQQQMGVVSNLITDMTLRSADEDEMARAVRHSMVVIDSEKHKLDYRQSAKDNDIAGLVKKYQLKVDSNGDYVYDENGNKASGGASTLLSRRKQTMAVNERKGSGIIDKETGTVTYRESGRSYINKKTGERVNATDKVNIIKTVRDANVLSSGTPQEKIYAEYANANLALADKARKIAVNIPRMSTNKEAQKTYAVEVASLKAKVNNAAKNAPLERRAQALARTKVKAMNADNTMDKDQLKKANNIAIIDARAQTGANGKGARISITDREWEAISSGALSDTFIEKSILRYADSDDIRERAMPHTKSPLSSAKLNKLKLMSNSGYTIAEIADALGVSTSTVSAHL